MSPPIKLCKVCGESKPAVKGSWVTLHGKPVGNVCLKCNAARCYSGNKKRQSTATGKALHKQLSSRWQAENKAKANATVRKYQTKLYGRLPAWLTEDDFFLIGEAYDLAVLRTKVTGIKWSVDHVVPLRGKKVCGLHVPNNLAVIPLKVNSIKGTSHD